MLTTTLRQHSVPITFAATVAMATLAMLFGLPSYVSTLHTGFFFAVAIFIFAVVLAIVSGNPYRANSGDSIDRNIFTFLAELIIWLCGPAILIFQRYNPESAQIFTDTVTALYFLSAVGVAIHIKRSGGCSFREVVLIPVSAASWLLVVGGNGPFGFGFLDAALPGQLLDTNALLRMVGLAAVAIWFLFGIGSGLLENYAKFRDMLNRRSSSATGVVLIAMDDFLAFLGEVIFSVARALVRSLRAIFNARAALISSGISLTVLLWIVIERLSEEFAAIASTYFSTHAYDWWVAVSFLMFMITILLSTIVDEMIADYGAPMAEIFDRGRRFVPLFACTTAALFLCAFLGCITFLMMRFTHTIDAESLQAVEGLSPSLSVGFLLGVPVLLLLRVVYRSALPFVRPLHRQTTEV